MVVLSHLIEFFNGDNMCKGKGNTVDTAHLDFQKAFDKVPYEGLLPGSGEKALPLREV